MWWLSFGSADRNVRKVGRPVWGSRPLHAILAILVFLAPFLPAFFVLIPSLTLYYLLYMLCYPFNPGLNTLLRKCFIPTLLHTRIASALLFGAPFLVVSRFIHAQQGSIMLRSGELPGQRRRETWCIS